MDPIADVPTITCTQSDSVCLTQVEHTGLQETFLHVVPPDDSAAFPEQIHAVYQTLIKTLETLSAEPLNLISQKLFFSDLPQQFSHYQTVRRRIRAEIPEEGPAVTCLQQPPAAPGRCVELQAHVMVATGLEPLVIRNLGHLPERASGSVIDFRGVRHIHLRNLTGAGAAFAAQAESMFETAGTALREVGASFHDVVRTWIYLSDLERDYQTFNPVRNAFFKACDLKRIPASTGIQGGAYPPDRTCLMDLYALQADGDIRIEPMRAATMNEAPEYGSAFSRGMAVTYEGWTTAYISGTASIDEAGRVMHIGDIEQQVHRMLTNVEALLEARGASFADTLSAVTYLKDPEFRDAFTRVARERGLPENVPNAVTVADVCRPEWLCEIELSAAFPHHP